MTLALKTGQQWFAQFMNYSKIESLLKSTANTEKRSAEDVIEKAKDLKGLNINEVAVLLRCDDPDAIEKLFEAARYVKEEIYGKRLVLFAPLYISNYCSNECLYCAFRSRNSAAQRRALSQQEIAEETRSLIASGQKRILLVAGEEGSRFNLDYILKSIDTVYVVHEGGDEIRRINVNIAPLSTEDFRRLKTSRIGTFQLFQETYHPPSYKKMHVAGPKTDYHWRLDAIDRAMEAGIDDVGIGVLFGLYDYRFEILALMQHIAHLESVFGVGPHTISVPRLEPAFGSEIAGAPPYPVSDGNFKKIVAILRVAVPYTGIIMSTRESPGIRNESFALGVSQISAGSRTNPGGYSEDEPEGAQFQLGDHRSLEEVIKDVVQLGYVPSFCTACYRLGRTGVDFMDLAKPGLIKRFCLPNAILTFNEYLVNHGSAEAKKLGAEAIAKHLKEIPSERRRLETEERLANIDRGECDLYF
jgi:2-iminoacetate synthase